MRPQGIKWRRVDHIARRFGHQTGDQHRFDRVKAPAIDLGQALQLLAKSPGDRPVQTLLSDALSKVRRNGV